ncbi:MAG: diacylglycerol kinase family protein [Pedobacter sp.]
MEIKHITFIINPASGKQEPILSLINTAMEQFDNHWEVEVTTRNRSASEIAAALIGKTDVVIVYGGDGTVTEVAAVLQGTDMLMGILPGGTANVMAKELGIPLDSTQALNILKEGAYQCRDIDMGLVNGTPFLLRVNLGIMADMVLDANRELKEKVGQLAYGITAMKTVANADPINYRMVIDGDVIEQSGVSLTVTNSGNIGIGDYALQPDISISDGFLDVLLMKDTSLLSMFKIASSTLLQTETEALLHYKCREVIIMTDQQQRFICDDHEEQGSELKISVLPSAIKILTPKTKI